MKKTLLFSYFFVISFSFLSQNYKGIYIDRFDLILGNSAREDSLFNYLKSNKFNAIALYDLYKLAFNNTDKSRLKSFISRAKTQYGIQYVTAVSEIASFFEIYVVPYNKGVTTVEQFNVFNLEFEFWVPESVSGYYCSTYLAKNGFSCDEAGAFKFYMQELKKIDAFCATNGWKSEIYLGWFNQTQADEMKLVADRILLSNYNADPNMCFDYSLARLEYLGKNSTKAEVVALFSSEPDFLHTWLTQNKNDLDAAYAIYQKEYIQNTGTWKNNITQNGQHWFKYSTMNYQLGNLGVDEMETKNNFIYPNPFSESIYLKNIQEEISIYDLNLNHIKTFNQADFSNENKLNLEFLDKGIYLLKCEDQIYRIIKN